MEGVWVWVVVRVARVVVTVVVVVVGAGGRVVVWMRGVVGPVEVWPSMRFTSELLLCSSAPLHLSRWGNSCGPCGCSNTCFTPLDVLVHRKAGFHDSSCGGRG